MAWAAGYYGGIAPTPGVDVTTGYAEVATGSDGWNERYENVTAPTYCSGLGTPGDDCYGPC